MGLNSLTRMAKSLPRSKRLYEGIEIHKDIHYDTRLRDSAHTLDVYKLHQGPVCSPVLLYIHGGGFRILSKDTHWMMNLHFARMGFTVFSINYRLAPVHPFPAAVEDCFTACRWIAENAETFGADTSQWVIAGESAGANLSTVITVASHFQPPEPIAKELYALQLPIKAVAPACGIFELSRPDRYGDNPTIPKFMRTRIDAIARAYYPSAVHEANLANPLLIFENEDAPSRSLPPFFIPVGSRDPIIDDSLRLTRALDRRGVEQEYIVYQREPHAFHALYWSAMGRKCWRDHRRFLERYLDFDLPRE